MNITIYTDGGCHGNPGPGGWAYVMLDESGNVIAEKSGREKYTTNNRMELLAVINALEVVCQLDAVEVTIFTDSRYVQQGISVWIYAWKKNGWITSGRMPVKNRDLWQRLDEFPFPVKWMWVKGHAGNVHNERCDKLTQEAIERINEGCF